MAIRTTIEFDLDAVISSLEKPLNGRIARCITEVTISPGDRAAFANYRRGVGKPDIVPFQPGPARLASE
jgi:hypothetical protein